MVYQRLFPLNIFHGGMQTLADRQPLWDRALSLPSTSGRFLPQHYTLGASLARVTGRTLHIIARRQRAAVLSSSAHPSSRAPNTGPGQLPSLVADANGALLAGLRTIGLSVPTEHALFTSASRISRSFLSSGLSVWLVCAHAQSSDELLRAVERELRIRGLGAPVRIHSDPGPRASGPIPLVLVDASSADQATDPAILPPEVVIFLTSESRGVPLALVRSLRQRAPSALLLCIEWAPSAAPPGLLLPPLGFPVPFERVLGPAAGYLELAFLGTPPPSSSNRARTAQPPRMSRPPGIPQAPQLSRPTGLQQLPPPALHRSLPSEAESLGPDLSDWCQLEGVEVGEEELEVLTKCLDSMREREGVSAVSISRQLCISPWCIFLQSTLPPC